MTTPAKLPEGVTALPLPNDEPIGCRVESVPGTTIVAKDKRPTLITLTDEQAKRLDLLVAQMEECGIVNARTKTINAVINSGLQLIGKYSDED